MEIILEDIEFTTIEEMEASLKQQYPDMIGWGYNHYSRELIVRFEEDNGTEITAEEH